MTPFNKAPEYAIERPVPIAMPQYHDQVRWGPIVAGLVVALSSQLVLSALGAAIGLTSIGGSGAPRSEAAGVGVNVGIWAIISLLLSLFVGGWVTARSSGRISRNTTLLNGVILWASVLALSAWLLSSGVSGAFGLAASSAETILNQTQQNLPGVIPDTANPQASPNPTPTITAQQTRDLAGNAAKVSWSFILGSVLGLGAALTGAGAGFRNTRTDVDRDLI